jgi:hypothetical protein
MRNRFLTFASLGILLMLKSFCFSQKVTISGFVMDASTNEVIAEAKVHILSIDHGTSTNSSGYYSLTLARANQKMELAVYAYGYQMKFETILPDSNQTLNVLLEVSEVKYLEGVEIIYVEPELLKQPEIGVLNIPMKTMKFIPTLGGEPDAIKAFQLMPGVQGGKEGISGLYVRGGTPDQNLFLLDDTPLYYVYHLGGFVSTFNPDAINSYRLYKGVFPAQYAGRLSSVVDIQMKDGNLYKRRGEFSIGLLAMKIQLDGPIGKDSTWTYYFSFRRSFFDLFIRPMSRFDTKGESTAGYTFYDLNGKVVKRYADGGKLSLTLYEGRDHIFINARGKRQSLNSIAYRYQSKVKWGNLAGNITYSKPLGPRWFAKFSIANTNFNFLTSTKGKFSNPGQDALVNESSIRFLSGVHDIIIKGHFEFQVRPGYLLKTGMTNTYHMFQPGIVEYTNANSAKTSVGKRTIDAYENNVFAENIFKVSNRFSFNAGFNLTSFIMSDTTFFSFQPRILITCEIIKNLNIQAGYSRMNQYMHYLANSSASLPSDIWIPVSKKLLPEKSNQYNFGFTYSIKDQKFPLNFTLEGYYKDMFNLLEYQEGSNLFQGDELEEKIISGGVGEVYGIEFLVQKNYGRINGWIGYTWSKNMRQFEALNNGKPFPFVYDRRHDAVITVSYSLTEQIQLSAVWTYATGNSITFAQALYNQVDLDYFNKSNLYYFNEAHIYQGRNSYKLPAFHKLDIGVYFKKKKPKGERCWHLGAYNAYNRQNTSFLFYKENHVNEITLHQMTLFPILPSVSYSYRFF